MSLVTPIKEKRFDPPDTARQQSHISLVEKDGHPLPGNSFSRVIASSAPSAWSELVIERHHCPAIELSELAYRQHVLVLNVGRSLVCEYKHCGRWRLAKKSPGSVSLFPSGQVFTRRMQTSAEVVYLALDPMVFVHHASEDLPPRPEFIEQRHEADLVLLHYARTLREASISGLRHDLLFGSSMALALARHLLTRYGSRPARSRTSAENAISSKTLKEAKEFIEAHLHSGMTVGQIAHAVRISPSHFTRLFKNATGLSPYRYVMRLRINRAKEMLVGSRCSLQEVTYSLGFADQSHLTREFRRAFGVTPKVLLEQPSTPGRNTVFCKMPKLSAS